MEQLVRQMTVRLAEEIAVNLLNRRVFMRLAERLALVLGIDGRHTLHADVNVLASRLAAAGDAAARERYLAMLRAPSTERPVEIVQRAGVDLLRPEAIRVAAAFFDQILDEIERIDFKHRRHR